jgi:uncharacterized membrane protein YdjX (TVP38/TMEM64 family)
MVAWPWRALATATALGLVAWRVCGFLRPIPAHLLRFVLTRIVRRWPTWIFGPLLAFALLVAVCLVALPDSLARNLAIIYFGLAFAGVRVAWIGAIIAAVVGAARRRK